MKTKKKITLLLIIGIIISFTTTSYATFSTGKGKHTFKIERYNAGPKLKLQSFLVGFGFSQQSAVNFKLTSATNYENEGQAVKANFLIPSFEGINSGNDFYLTGPILDAKYQYIPKHELFVTPNSLNAIQGGLKIFNGGKASDGTEVKEKTNLKAYFEAGLLSRSRWENYNLFSDLNLIYEPRETGGWLLESQLGMEFKWREHFRSHISYKVMGSAVDSRQGFSVGVRANY